MAVPLHAAAACACECTLLSTVCAPCSYTTSSLQSGYDSFQSCSQVAHSCDGKCVSNCRAWHSWAPMSSPSATGLSAAANPSGLRVQWRCVMLATAHCRAGNRCTAMVVV